MQDGISEHGADGEADETGNDGFVDAFSEARNQENPANRSRRDNRHRQKPVTVGWIPETGYGGEGVMADRW